MTDQELQAKVLAFFKDVFESYMEHDCSDIDGADIHEWLYKHGLACERAATEENCKDEWAQSWGIEPGEMITDYTTARQAIAMLSKGKDA